MAKSSTKNSAPAEPSAPEVAAVAQDDTPVVAADAAAALYRDKSGTNRAQQLTEGAANFGAITAAARALLETDQPDEAA